MPLLPLATVHLLAIREDRAYGASKA